VAGGLYRRVRAHKTDSPTGYFRRERKFHGGVRPGMQAPGIWRGVLQSSNRAILRTFDQSAMDTLFMGPDIQILVTRTSANLPKYPGTMTGLTLHALQGCGVRQSCARMHLQFGFRKEFLSVKKCATPADLADLVLASSCTPPFTAFYSLHGRPVLDGGLSESVPLSGLPEKGGTALVLLTSKGAKEKRIPGIVFAEPSQELNINGWDYDAKKIDYLYALGKKDGGTFFEAKVI
jgi:hypothetical protein